MGGKSSSGSARGAGVSSVRAVTGQTTSWYVAQLKSEFGVRLDLKPTDNPKIAEAVYAVTQEIVGMGYEPIPRFARVDHPTDRAIAKADAGRNVVLLNLGNPIWQNDAEHKKLEASGWITDGSTRGTITHEAAHLLHSRRITTNDAYNAMSTASPRTASSVSRYATTNQLEFVAEVFAGQMSGKKYSKDVLKEYEALNGPPVKKGRR